MERRNDGFFTGAFLFAAGAVIGAGVALLLAPQSGRETRKDIARGMKKAGRRAEEVAGELTETVSGMADAVGERVEEILGTGKDLAVEAKKELIGAIEEGQRRLEKQKARLSKLIA